MKLPEIPKTWLIAILLIALVGMRFYGIDSFTTSALSLIIGWLVGVKLEQVRHIEAKRYTDKKFK